MYKIKQVTYLYWHELTDYMDSLQSKGYEIIGVLQLQASGDNKKPHQADILTKFNKDDMISCMYCEKELKKNEAIVVCKECTE